MRFVFVLLIAFWQLPAFAQSIHTLEPISGHYKTLQALSAKPNKERAQLDTLAFPPDKYGWSIVYSMVTPYYLAAEQVDFLKSWLAAPANSSDQTRAELDYLLSLQAKRTPAQVERVTFLGDIGYWSHVDLQKSHPGYQKNLQDLFFEGYAILGKNCTAENYPKTAQLLKGVMQDMRIMEFSVKYQNLRARPYHLEPKLQPLAIMGSPAFASGHTLWAYIQAYLWSELLPDKRQQFLDLAEEIRQSREIMGIHYPSDNEAARVLAHKMLELMMYNAQFQQDYQAAAAEWQSNKTAAK
ncbi:MAG: hypothetical protein ACK4TA_08665 [Saprospiraceae bacterium]